MCLGQVQTLAGERVTVNFEHVGKRLGMMRHAELDIVKDESSTP
jgi:hypothetical protein